jgi:hypothetical protein
VDHEIVLATLRQHPFDESSEVTATLCHRLGNGKVWLVMTPDRPDKSVLMRVRELASDSLKELIAPAKLICVDLDASSLKSATGSPPGTRYDRTCCHVWEMDEVFEAPKASAEALANEWRDELEAMVKLVEAEFPEFELEVDLGETNKYCNIRVTALGAAVFLDPIGAFRPLKERTLEDRALLEEIIRNLRNP